MPIPSPSVFLHVDSWCFTTQGSLSDYLDAQALPAYQLGLATLLTTSGSTGVLHQVANIAACHHAQALQRTLRRLFLHVASLS